MLKVVAKHTEGPWSLGPRFQDKVDVLHKNDQPGAASRTIARVTVRDSWEAEQEANARLIGKSPEMFELLREARTQLPIAMASWHECEDSTAGEYHVQRLLYLISTIDALFAEVTGEA